MDNRFEPLAIGEVLSVDESSQILIGHRTFRVSEFAEAIRSQLEYGIAGWTEDKNAWFSEDGLPCEVLRFTANGWQKGRVRLNLEFCPQDFEDDHKEASATSNVQPVQAAPADSEDELDLDLVEPAIASASASVDVEPAFAQLTDTDDQLDLRETDSDDDDQLDLGETVPPLTTTEFDELDLMDSSALMDSPTTEVDDFDVGTLTDSDLELEQDVPVGIYVEIEQEVLTLSDDELDMVEMPTSLDDDLDLGEISQSIEQELELVEAPSAGGDELDFDDLSSEGSDDLDFGEMSAINEDDFQFEDISANNDSEDNETDSLLDDVWQDMNEASWQNNH